MNETTKEKYNVQPYYEATVRLDPASYRAAGENNKNGLPKTLSGSMRRNDEATEEGGRLVLDYNAPTTSTPDPLKQTRKLEHGRVTVNSRRVFYTFTADIVTNDGGMVLNASAIAGDLISESDEATDFITDVLEVRRALP